MGMKLQMHVDRKKVGVKLETTEVEWREGEQEEGGLCTPQGALWRHHRHVGFVPASRLAISLRIRSGNFRLNGAADDLRRTLTPSQFAPDSENKRLATFG